MSKDNQSNHSSQDLATFAKKKGFIYPSSEIYGGLAGFYDYGHLGTMLKHNFQNVWRKFFLDLNQNFYEIETANIMHKNVFKASGHLENFADPIVHCAKLAKNKNCDWSARADHLLEEHTKQRAEDLTSEQLTTAIKKADLKCPECNSELQDVETMNMMFPVNLGVGSKGSGYLRPETAQSPYVNFKAQYELQRKKLPMGLALIGRAYRNEISPRNLTIRLREFTQAELQIFFNPNLIEEHEDFESIKDVKIQTLLLEDRKTNKIVQRSASELVTKHNLPKFYIYHLVKIQEFYLNHLKIPKTHIRFYQLNDKEKAFYNKFHFDIEADLNTHGWTEIGGLHYRTDHALSGHQKVSKTKMEIFDEQSKQKFIPHVLELSFGVDRNVYTLLDLNYQKDQKENKDARGNDVLNLPKSVTPFTAAVLPLVKNKQPITNKAKEVLKLLKDNNVKTFYDEVSSIGRRYARADEAGIKYAITIDFDTLALDEDSDPKLKDTVTVRDRNTSEQTRVKITDLIKEIS